MVRTRRLDAVLLLVAAVWGSSYLAAKTASAAAPVVDVLFVRYALSLLACVAILRAAAGARVIRAEWRSGGVLGLTQAAVLALETYGVAHTSAANAGLIISTTIVLTPMLDRRRGQARLPGAFFGAAGLSALGVTALVSSAGFRAPGAGDVLVLLAAFVRAGHVVLLGRLTTGRAVRPLQLTSVQLLVGTTVFAVAGSGQWSALAHLSAATWAVLAYLALGCSVFAFLAQTWAVQQTSPSRASLLLGTEPVWAVATGVVVGGEHLGAVTAVGAALVVVGAYWGQLVEARHRHRTVVPGERYVAGRSAPAAAGSVPASTFSLGASE